jgi:hypothetical protein
MSGRKHLMDWSRYNGPLARWVRRELVPAPDPWPAAISASVKEKSSVPLCTNCLFPQGPHVWFCPHCGFPSGDYVVIMPYLDNFVVGELFRRCVIGPPERRRGVQLFLFLYSLAAYSVFAPVYWYWMVRRALGRPIGVEKRPELEWEEYT